MNDYKQPYLEKYTGRDSRHKCPKCGDPHSFVYYLDGNTGQPIDKAVGRCNHESRCGYHYTPKQFFSDNPMERERRMAEMVQQPKPEPQTQPKREIGHIPFFYVEKSTSYNSAFVYFLCGLFDRYSLESPTIERVARDYALGATKEGDVIFWQIDVQGRVRTGEIIRYNKDTGHRFPCVDWTHSRLKKRKLLPDNYNLVQCFFGEHLLKIYPDKIVALVESAKSAVIASGVFPNYVWLATGGKTQLSIDKLQVLKGRTVIMFPDVDGFDYWTKKAKDIEAIGCKVIVSDLLEKNATDEEREKKIDIADWLVRYLSEATVTEARNEISEAERMLQVMIEANPAVQTLIDMFNLELVA